MAPAGEREVTSVVDLGPHLELGTWTYRFEKRKGKYLKFDSCFVPLRLGVSASPASGQARSKKNCNKEQPRGDTSPA